MSNPSVEDFEETQDCIILTDDDKQCKCFNEPFFDDNITQTLQYSADNKYSVCHHEDLRFKPGRLQGSYSNVFLCCLVTKPEETLVLKQFSNDRDANKYNARNIYFCEKLKHDALPEVVGYLLEKGNIAAILFKHCGVSLLNYILEKDAPVSNENPLGHHNEDIFIEWADQLAKVVQHMHDAKIPHRDISPHNILIQVNNKLPHGSKLILTDLGSARFMNIGMTRDHGKPGYMAPEEFYESGQTRYCCKVDTYSFGMVWYFAITKTEPFENIRETLRGKRSGLGNFLHKTNWNTDEIAAYENKASVLMS